MSTNHSTLPIAIIGDLIDSARYRVAMLNMLDFSDLCGDFDAGQGIHSLLQSVVGKLGEAGKLLIPEKSEAESLD